MGRSCGQRGLSARPPPPSPGHFARPVHFAAKASSAAEVTQKAESREAGSGLPVGGWFPDSRRAVAHRGSPEWCGRGSQPSEELSWRAGAAQKRPRGCPRPPQAPRAAALKGKARRGIEKRQLGLGAGRVWASGRAGCGPLTPKGVGGPLGLAGGNESKSWGANTHRAGGQGAAGHGGPTLVTACVLRNGN